MKPCLICFKPLKDGPSCSKSSTGNTTTKPCPRSRKNTNENKSASKLKSFFNSLETYIINDDNDDDKPNAGNGNGGTHAQFKSSIEPFIHQGRMASCEECSKTMAEFCDLYERMKGIELELNWKLRTLNEVMDSSQRGPSSLIKDFKKVAKEQGLTDKNADQVIQFKKDVVIKCKKKLQKLDVPPTEVAHVGSAPIFKIKIKRVPAADDNDGGVDGGSDDDTTGMYVDPLLGYYGTDNDDDEAPLTMEGLLALDQSEMYDDQSLDSSLVSEGEPNEAPTKSGTKSKSPKKAAGPSHSQPASQTKKSLDPATGKYSCSQCPSEFTNPRTLNRHLAEVHSKLKYQCTDCGQKFSRMAHYNRHYDHIHLGIKFECDQCHTLFSRKDKLQHHRRKGKCGQGQQ